MRHGISLFASDRGVRPAFAGKAAEERGFHKFYVPEHSHIPIDRTGVHPATQSTTELPNDDDRYLRTLDPWVGLATVAEVTSTIGLSTSVALPLQSDPITLAKTIATLDYLSDGRVTLGAGFGWNLDEMTHHGIPFKLRREYLREWLQAMEALWTQEEASYDGEYVSFKRSWAWPKPVQEHINVVIGVQPGPRNFRWIAENADGWVSTPIDQDLPTRALELQDAWATAGRSGKPIINVHSPDFELLEAYAEAGVDECIWRLESASEDVALRFLDDLSARLSLS